MRKRYMFFDLDGTLLAGGYEKSYLPNSTLKAIAKLRADGHFLALCTGRSEAMARDWLNKLEFAHMVSDGGNGLTIDHKLLGITPLDRDAVAALIHECDEKNLPWALQLANSKVRSAPDGRFLSFTTDTYMRTEVVDNLRPENCPAIYKAYIACRQPAEDSLQSLRNLPWGRYHEDYIFVEPMRKAAGIREMLGHIGAPCQDVIVFGDSRNDLSMFSGDWVNVAMGNAHPDLKKHADLVTANVDDDGIYRACEDLGLL